MPDAAVPTEDVLSRQEQKREPLYAGQVKVYPKRVDGPIRRVKWAVLALLLAAYYVAPWLRWDRGPGLPDQAILVDFPDRKFYFFFIEIWPQEFYYVTGLLILCALALFLATAIGGRVWCGYTCPQTVWTDLYLWIERHLEGDRNARMRLDKAPWSAGKVARKAAKHAAWLLIALLTGGAWMMYFKDAPTLVAEVFTGQASFSIYFFVGLLTATTYLLAGHAREQVCTYMCPWPRFQSALLDEDSLVVTYDRHRGEPRGHHRKGDAWEGRGHCIDDRQCVAVCPTGIDIRDGLQLECIGCGLCVDACNTVMDKVGLPRGLVRFDTERNMRRLARGQPPAGRLSRLVRPRTILYSVLILAIAAAITLGLGGRSSVDVNVLHDRNPLYVTLSDGSIRNGYTLKILNRSREPQGFRLTVPSLPEADVTVAGLEEQEGAPVLAAGADSVASYRVFVSVPPRVLATDSRRVDLVLTGTESGETVRNETVLRGPS